jgi:glycosyltransferase involved in cell wall biosynthesis
VLVANDDCEGLCHLVFVMNTTTARLAATRSPLVSVIIPAYQAAEHIGAALESALGQTFSNHEVIVINDGSPDRPQLLQALRPYRDRIRYLEHSNQGPSAARNSGVLAAKGEYVAFLDSDDFWFPSYLEEQMRVLQGPPDLDLVYCNARRVGALAGDWPTCMGASPSHGPVTFESLAREQCTVLTSFTVTRRQAVLDAGLFDVNFRRSEDFDLWLRMAYRGLRMGYHRMVLGSHELREEGLSGDRDALREAQVAVYRKLLLTLELCEERAAMLQAQIERCEALVQLDRGKDHLLSGRYREAVLAIRQANAFYRRPRFSVALALLPIMPWVVRQVYKMALQVQVASRQARNRIRREPPTIPAATSSSPRQFSVPT